MARTEASYSTASQAPMLQRVWTSMRIHRRFTTADLMATADATESPVLRTIRALHGAGYLRLAVPRVSGRPGSRDVWQLVRDSGPLVPIRRADGSGVYDPNTSMVWGTRGELLQDAPPPAPPSLPQAARDALRQLAQIGSANVTPATVHTLLRAGMVTLALTEAGRRAVDEAPVPARNQRDGRAQADDMVAGDRRPA